MKSRIVSCAWACVLCLLTAGLETGPATHPRHASFSNDVAPILLRRCLECHGPKKSKGKFRLDTYQRLTRSGESDEPSITPGSPARSKLFQLISTTDEDDRMPKKADPLPANEVLLIKQWIEQGARFDGADPSVTLTAIVPRDQHARAPQVYQRPVPITALAFSPDGKELAASGYREVTIWDPSNGKLVGRIGGLAERTWSIGYSPRENLMVVAGGTPAKVGEVRLCDPAARSSGRVIESIADMMLVARFSPDGRKLAAAGADSAIGLYDVTSGKREWLIEQHADWVTDLAFSPDGARLASASRDKSARIFDAATGSMLAAYLGHENAVLTVAWSEDGKVIYSAGQDRTIHIWNATDARKAGRIDGFDGELYKIDAAMGMLFAGSTDGIVREYSTRNRKLVRAFEPAGDWVYCVAVDPNHHLVAAGYYNGQVRVWNIDTGGLVVSFFAAPGFHAGGSASSPR